MKTKPAAVILCGGESQRMGFPKWQLPFNGGNFQQTLLERLISIIRPEVSKIILSVNDQPVELFKDFETDGVVADFHSGSGPLEGIRTSLEFLADDCEAAFVTACDVPAFPSSVISHMTKRLTDEYQAVIPVDTVKENRRVFGMTAVYRCSTHKAIKTLIDQRRLKVSFLADELKARIVDMQEMRTFDPNLDSLSNINIPKDYFAALEQLKLQTTSHVKTNLESSDN